MLCAAGREVLESATDVLDESERLVHGFVHTSEDVRVLLQGVALVLIMVVMCM
jgi:hypothetical protein